MNNIITITQTIIDGAETNAVNSREIYKELEIKQGYSDWIKYQISKLNLKKDKDFTKHIYVIGKNKITDYIVTTDAAKNIGLISFSERGQEIRNYFIEIEKEAQLLVPNAMKEVKLALAGLVEVDQRLDSHHDRIRTLEETRRMENWQEKALIDAHHKKVYEIAEMYGDDRNDKTLIRKLHQKAWSLFKKHFILPRYSELNAARYKDGLAFINNLALKDMT